MGHKDAARRVGGSHCPAPTPSVPAACRTGWEPSPLACLDIWGFNGARLEVREKEAAEPRVR